MKRGALGIARAGVAAILVLSLAAGCGGVVVVDQEGAPAPAARGCGSDAECAGGYCVGPQGCDAVWACVDEIPCSAAAPFMACTCDGTWRSLASGCPEERYAHADWSHSHDDGEPCDVTASP